MKYILYCILFLYLLSPLHSQDFVAENLIVFPGEYNSHEAFHIDQMGNHFIAGRGTGEIDFDFGPGTSTLPENSFKDLYLSKYDESGNFLWVLSFEGTVISNQIRAMVTDEDGNVYIAGAFSGSLHLSDDGQNEITSFGATSMFVAKFDISGNLQWKFTVGDTNFSQYPDEMYIYDNRLIIQFVYAGTFDVDPGNGETLLSGSTNAMLVYNLDGSFLEANTHRNNTNVMTSAMDNEGNLYLGGLFSGLVSFDYKTNASLISVGLFDAFVVKYDKDFNMIWLKKVGKSLTSNHFRKLTLDANNDIIVGGVLESGITIGMNETQNDAYYLLKISKGGEYQGFAEILPESSFITDIESNSKNQIILSARFSEVIDIDFSEETREIVPLAGDNIFFAVYDSTLLLLGSDQINATEINTHSVYMDDSEEIHILTDFNGQGKVVFGSPDNFETENEENFTYYKLDIEGCSPSEEDIELAACDEVVVNMVTYDSSGVYQQILTNADGCDSILNIAVTVFEGIQLNTSLSACDFITLENEIITESGQYTLPLINMNGCDSVVVVDLTIINIDNNISMNENELIAEESQGDSYQWYDCESMLPIEKETNRSFFPTADGSYQVEITKSFCTTVTACIDFVLVGTEEFDIEFKISPNPTEGMIYIQTENYQDDYYVSLFDLSGKVVVLPIKLNSNRIIDLNELSKGIYLLKIENKTNSVYKRIILN